MLDAKKLKEKIVENELNVEKVAELINMHRATLYRKINNAGDTLTIKEANAICQVLNLTSEDAVAIFFRNYVA